MNFKKIVKNLTSIKLAGIIGVSVSTAWRKKQGRIDDNFTLSELAKILKQYDIDNEGKNASKSTRKHTN